MSGNDIQTFEDLKLSNDKHVLYQKFHALDMDGLDIILGYPWLESFRRININMQKKSTKLSYRNKVTLKDITQSEVQIKFKEEKFQESHEDCCN